MTPVFRLVSLTLDSVYCDCFIYTACRCSFTLKVTVCTQSHRRSHDPPTSHSQPMSHVSLSGPASCPASRILGVSAQHRRSPHTGGGALRQSITRRSGAGGGLYVQLYVHDSCCCNAERKITLNTTDGTIVGTRRYGRYTYLYTLQTTVLACRVLVRACVASRVHGVTRRVQLYDEYTLP